MSPKSEVPPRLMRFTRCRIFFPAELWFEPAAQTGLEEKAGFQNSNVANTPCFLTMKIKGTRQFLLKQPH